MPPADPRIMPALKLSIEQISAIVANLHDIVIILGFFAFFQWE